MGMGGSRRNQNQQPQQPAPGVGLGGPQDNRMRQPGDRIVGPGAGPGGMMGPGGSPGGLGPGGQPGWQPGGPNALPPPGPVGDNLNYHLLDPLAEEDSKGETLNRKYSYAIMVLSVVVLAVIVVRMSIELKYEALTMASSNWFLLLFALNYSTVHCKKVIDGR